MQGDWEKYSKNFISALISIDKSTNKNGCLEFDVSGNNHLYLKGKLFKKLKISSLKNQNLKNFYWDLEMLFFF